MRRAVNLTYDVTVEGECEKRYFEWLEKQINAKVDPDFFKVKIKAVVSEPGSYAKRVSLPTVRNLCHVCDIESSQKNHQTDLENRLRTMKEITERRGGEPYFFAYSNFTFELWMILHKMDCNGTLSDRKQYLTKIRQAYDIRFESLSKYKEEKNFDRCLQKLKFEDVFEAIKRSKAIMKTRQENRDKVEQFAGYTYYTENPSLTIGEFVESVLVECELLHK